MTDIKNTENAVVAISLDKAVALKGRKAIEFFSNKENIDGLIEVIKTKATTTVFDMKKKKDRDAVGSIALKISQSRKVVTEASKASVADLNTQVKATKDVNKHWETELNEIRRAVLAPRDEWQAKEDEIQEARIAKIKESIAGIHAIGVLTGIESKQDLANLIDAVDTIDVAEGFEEFAQEAAQAAKDVLKALNDQVLVIVEQDRKAEQDRLLLEANQRNAIAERLGKLRNIPMSVLGSSAAAIQNKITSIESVELLEDEFGESLVEALNLVEVVIGQLNTMLDQAITLEEQAEIVAQAAIAAQAEPAPEIEPTEIEGVVTGSDLVAEDVVEAMRDMAEPVSGSKFGSVPESAHTQENYDEVFNDEPLSSPSITNETIAEFLKGQLNDVTDFGYLLVSPDPQQNAEAMANLRAKFKAFIGEK